MKKQLLFVPVVMLFTTVAFSQTKRIALHSHSGANNEFNVESEDNFGLPPTNERIQYNRTQGDTVNLTQKSNNTQTAPAKTDTAATKTPAKATKKKNKQSATQK